MSPADDFLAATHESAHGCVASMFGFSVKHIVLHHIGANQHEQGRCELRDHVREIDENPTRYLCYLLAGASGEKRAVGHFSARDAQDREDARNIAAIILNQEPDAPRVAAMVDRAQVLANAMMLNDDLWRWVERTARALVKKRRLTGRDIHELRGTP